MTDMESISAAFASSVQRRDDNEHLANVARRAIAALADGNTLAAVNILRQELPDQE